MKIDQKSIPLVIKMKKIVDKSQDIGVRKPIKSYKGKVNNKDLPITSRNLNTKINART